MHNYWIVAVILNITSDPIVLEGFEALSFKLYRFHSKFGLFKNTSYCRLCYKLHDWLHSCFYPQGWSRSHQTPGSKVYIDGLNTECSLAQQFYFIRDVYYYTYLEKNQYSQAVKRKNTFYDKTNLTSNFLFKLYQNR